MKKGFTLIELLIVIAVLGILAAVTVTAINPVRRLNQANDSKVKNDVGEIAGAMEAYFTTTTYYPTAQADLVTSQDLKVALTAPTGYAAYVISAIPAGCTTAAGTCTAVSVRGQLKAPAVATNVAWCWRSATGQSTETTVALCVP